MLAEAEVAGDRRLQPADGLGHRGHPDTGLQLVRIGDSAHALAPFQDQRRKAGPGEIGGGHETVMATADDHRVPAPLDGGHRQATFRPVARRTSIAAIRPLAPMIPPPG